MRERTCACGQCQVRQGTRRDTWMTWNETCCATLYVLYLWVYCSHHPSIVWSFLLQSTETSPNSEKKFTNRQGLKNAENPNCSSSNGFGPTLTKKLSAGWPATLLLTARNGSVFFLGPCQVLVVQSFAFSSRLSKIRSLIEWLLKSFCICSKNPMFRISNSPSSCCDVDVLLQGDSVVQHYVFFSPPDDIQRVSVRFTCAPS